jgi:glycosyltransferase involved in cell wall biosynthesis
MTFAANLLPRLLVDRPDVVLNLAGPASGRVCRLLRLLRGTPFLHSAQGMAQGRLEWIHARQRPNRYLALSLPNQQWIEARAPWVKTCLVPNGVDGSLFSPEGEAAKVALRPPIILFVGAMDAVKRPDLTIRAAARLCAKEKKNGGASLLMIGDGRIRREVESLGLRLLGDRFLVLPRVGNSELPGYYRACSVFTLASPLEPFGIVFLEAMACNRPVVAQEGVVQKWLLGEGGICCDCEDEEGYADSLLLALKKECGDRPRSRALEFDWSRIIGRYESVFHEVVWESRQCAGGA